MAKNDIPPAIEDQMNPAQNSNDEVLNNTNTNACVTVGPSTPSQTPRNDSDTVDENAKNGETTTTMALTVPVPEIDVQMSPRLRAIAQTGSMKVNFDHGYDSDGEIGPFFMQILRKAIRCTMRCQSAKNP